MTPPPEHIQASWQRIHDELQRRLEALYERRTPFKLWAEILGEGGVPREVQWYEHDRQQPTQTPARTKAS